METWKLITFGVVVAILGAILLEVWLKRGKKTATLADTLGKQSRYEEDETPELGMEEIDMDIVRAAARENANHEDRDWKLSKR